ncbi:MAG: hypothetical protein CSA81_14150 [Acidobacteria bacterium]|nr:MAG: hypothetical protein CSA81_14150 [Acidobacteriota bacterium]
MTINTKYKAHYPLPEVKKLVQAGAVILSRRNALLPAVTMGLTKTALLDCILELTPGKLLKSTEDWNHKGLWQDAYCTRFEGRDVYVKLQIKSVEGEKVIVTSFHEPNKEEF